MLFRRRERRYGYTEKTKKVIEESKKVREEWRALTKKLEEQKRLSETAKNSEYT